MTTPVVPVTPAEFQESLQDVSKVQQLLKDGEFTNFVNKYVDACATQKVGKDIDEQVRSQVEAVFADFVKDNKPANKTNVTWTHGTPSLGNGAVRNAAYNPKAPAAQLDGTYEGIGDFALDVYRANKVGAHVGNQEAWNKVVELTNNYSENDPGSGGFLVPEEMRSTLLSLALEQSVVRSRATVITMSTLTTKIPFVDETTHSGSVFGGMVFYWIGESASISPTNATFGNVKLEANKLVGGARVPNELWADAPALRTWLEANAPRGLAFYEDQAFVNGNGVGQPLGFLQSPAVIQASRAGANTTIAIADLAGMYARMLPSSLGNAVWLVNQTALPQLFTLNATNYPMGIVNFANGPMTTLLGRPMIVTEQMPALANGSGNEIMFADLSYYLVGDRQAVSLDYSPHSRFMNDETELRLIERVDGRPWIQSALTPLHGDTLSPFVGLAD